MFDISAFTAPDADRPPEPVAIDWPVIEEWLGTRLPDDYKELAAGHGPLDFGEYIWIHVPCAGERFDYGTWLRDTHRQARITARDMPPEDGWPEHGRPLVFHPEPGGLLAWGETRGSDVLFWDTSRSGDPNEWTVVVHHSPTGRYPGNGLGRWHRYDLTLGGYLRHTVRDTWAMPSPPGPLIGPLPGTIARTGWIPDARPWTPPEPVPPRLTAAGRRVALETGTGLDALRLLVPPPRVPALGRGTWEGLFEELGTVLPHEYVALMNAYGAGSWMDWLGFYPPLRTGERRFTGYVAEVMDAYRQLRDEFPEWHPLTPWPGPGAFLPFATSADGDEVGWLTDGDDPGTWPLIVWPRHADQGPPLEHGLIDTLLAWLRGTFSAEGFAGLDSGDDPLEFARFTPWTDDAR